ncbi:MAG: DUF1761 domain-containing protein [Lewinellaceae bacterium]|nr:DUF1761 domain-containing protein [Lewinellaceae bacterium]
MEFNWIVLFGAALIPFAIGGVWYHPKVLGTAWMRAAGLNEEQLKGGNMAVIFGLTYFLGLLLAAVLITLVIHQVHVGSILMEQPGFEDPQSEVGQLLSSFNEKYGQNFRTFKHGALHGTIAALFFALPVLGINALFERKSGKYIAIHTGYWVVTIALMGGVICAYL